MVTGLLLAVLAQTAAPVKLAAVEWKGAGLEQSMAGYYSSEFSRLLRDRGFTVYTQEDIAAMIGQERQKQLLGCADGNTSCLVELSNALGTAGMVVGSLAKLDDYFRVNIRVLDASQAKVLAETVAEAKGARAFVDALESAADRIAQGLRPGSAVTGVSTGGGLRKKAWVPAVAGGALVIGGAVLVGLAYGTKGQIQSSPLEPTSDAVTSLRASGATYQTVGWIGVGLGVAALAGAGAMFLFGDSPVTPTAMVTPSGGMFAIGGSFP